MGNDNLNVNELTKLRDGLISQFRLPVDIPVTAQKLELESRKGNSLRQFKHLHQSCTMASWDFQEASKLRLVHIIDAYLALYSARTPLLLYSVTRSMLELNGLILHIYERLHQYTIGDASDWKSRGEGFFKYVTRARWGTRDAALISKLIANGVPKSALEPIHSKDCESSLQKIYPKDTTAYATLSDYVHTNSQGFYVGSPGWFMSDLVNLPNGHQIKLPQMGPVNRYQYPAPEKFAEALKFTAPLIHKHANDAALKIKNLPHTPYSKDEIQNHTGNEHGTVLLPISTKAAVSKKPSLGRNEPCFCGSGKKFKNCHLKLEDS